MPGPSNHKKPKAAKKKIIKPLPPKPVSSAPKPVFPTPTDHDVVPKLPFIYDPGNGPRVRDTGSFLSSFFAQAPAMDIPMCAEFAQEEIRQMLSTVLPEETALILWYNKSRATSRICPACQRLYHLGDALPNLMGEDADDSQKGRLPQLQREQELSGLCSPVCFILASCNFPEAIKSAWGHTEDEMDDKAWSMLNAPLQSDQHGELSTGLSMLVRMTRLYDLGLAQLCFPDMDLDS
ncbi:hypothetical protein ARMSODRAFT_1016713 [Armillaria solidipes]|uniref:Uncharacterized protein n=1 Tax=Armillaria solidipes TaxID=1076256 RepID=A0A2H3C6F5_9AGAR|nr:hypothetical protein ARMSODRAFT_1016713 [Armillaria solidipes]